MTLEYSPTGYQLRVYDNEGDTNYKATANVQKYSDVGVMTAMLGKRLFINIYKNREQFYKDTGIRFLVGYVYTNIAATISLLGRNRKLSMTTGREGVDDKGREVIWIDVDLIG